jgi:hypothetical protein
LADIILPSFVPSPLIMVGQPTDPGRWTIFIVTLTLGIINITRSRRGWHIVNLCSNYAMSVILHFFIPTGVPSLRIQIINRNSGDDPPSRVAFDTYFQSELGSVFVMASIPKILPLDGLCEGWLESMQESMDVSMFGQLGTRFESDFNENLDFNCA